MPRSRLVPLLIGLMLGLTGWQGPAIAADALPGPLDTSNASPVASPAESALSCGAPGYHPIVHEEVSAADLEAAGLSGMPIVPSQDTTIEAANGTSITLPAGRWSPARVGHFAFIGGGESTTAISLATGESWTLYQGSDGSSSTMLGPWLVGAANDTSTDFWIINSETGASLLTSEAFGVPFTEARTANSWLPPGVSDTTPTIISFFATQERDLAPDALVLPSADPDDAWTLDPADAAAALNGTITADGSRIVLVDSHGNRIRVLDGFTGEGIANYRAPETDDSLRLIGVAGDDTTLLLRDGQRVWSFDIETGEFSTLLGPDVAVPEVVFDVTTGTALATITDGADTRYVWLDPASGAVSELDIENPEYPPGPQDGWALLRMRDDGAIEYALLDMATGEFATEPIRVSSDARSINPFQTGAEHGIWIVQGEPEQLLVFDGPGGRAFELPLPEENGTEWGAPAHGVSPNGECIIYTRLGSLFEDPPGISWIALVEPGAEWTVVPFEINGWLEVPEG